MKYAISDTYISTLYENDNANITIDKVDEHHLNRCFLLNAKFKQRTNKAFDKTLGDFLV